MLSFLEDWQFWQRVVVSLPSADSRSEDAAASAVILAR
jgi:hypothetical protein